MRKDRMGARCSEFQAWRSGRREGIDGWRRRSSGERAIAARQMSQITGWIGPWHAVERGQKKVSLQTSNLPMGEMMNAKPILR